MKNVDSHKAGFWEFLTVDWEKRYFSCADPEGRTGGPDPPEKSQNILVILVRIP